MPTIPRPSALQYIAMPHRRAIDAGKKHVLVVGGGLPGMAAAWGAAKAGADTLLVEREGYLGGDATAALVTTLMSYRSQHPRKPEEGTARLFPADYGDGTAAVGGFYLELVNRLVREGGAIPPSAETGFTLALDPEILKLAALDLMEDAGVGLLFYAQASNVLGERAVEGVLFETKSGPLCFRADAVVDCTGDGDIAALAGAPFALGREQDGLTQPVTVFFIVQDFDKDRFDAYCRAHPGQWQDVYGLEELIRQAEQAGDLHLQRENILMFATPYKDAVLVDSTRVTKVNGTDVWDLSRASVENLRQVKEIADFLKGYVPGFEHSRVAQSAPAVYVRESRRILGDYVLTSDDILEGRTFSDVVARGAYCIDIHNPDGRGTFVRHLLPGTVYDIPLRCLLPRETDNLLVAGRAISGTHVAEASYRILAIGSATGQAAGVCAALASLGRIPPRRVDPKDVQSVLREQKANLGGMLPQAGLREKTVFSRRMNVSAK
jgi:hypothetical protein